MAMLAFCGTAQVKTADGLSSIDMQVPYLHNLIFRAAVVAQARAKSCVCRHLAVSYGTALLLSGIVPVCCSA